MVTSEQIVNGLMMYVDKEMIPKLDTASKWIVGTLVGILGVKAENLALKIQSNELAVAVGAVGAVNEDGLFDIDLIFEQLEKSAKRYGKLQINIPMLGIISLDDNDVKKIKQFIKGE